MRFLQCTYEGGYRGVTPDFYHLSVGAIDTETADRLLFDYPTWFKEITREEFDDLTEGRWDGEEVPFVTYTTPPVDLARKFAEEAAAKRAEMSDEIPMDPPIEDAAEVDAVLEETTEEVPAPMVDLSEVAHEEAAAGQPEEVPAEEPAAEEPAVEEPADSKPKGRSRGR